MIKKIVILVVIFLLYTNVIYGQMNIMGDKELSNSYISVIEEQKDKMYTMCEKYDVSNKILSPTTKLKMSLRISFDGSYYHHPWANNGTNQWYWGGGTTTTFRRIERIYE